MVLREDSVARVSVPDRCFTFHYDPRMLTLLKVIPRVLERCGVSVSRETVVVRWSPGAEIHISQDAITRVWRTHRSELGSPSWLPPLFGIHTNFSGVWWMNASVDNLVALDIHPPATGRIWGIPIKPRRVVVSLDDPEGFIAEVLG